MGQMMERNEANGPLLRLPDLWPLSLFCHASSSISKGQPVSSASRKQHPEKRLHQPAGPMFDAYVRLTLTFYGNRLLISGKETRIRVFHVCIRDGKR